MLVYGIMDYNKLKERLKKDFESEYDGGYTFSEVENVIAWTMEWVTDYLQEVR